MHICMGWILVGGIELLPAQLTNSLQTLQNTGPGNGLVLSDKQQMCDLSMNALLIISGFSVCWVWHRWPSTQPNWTAHSLAAYHWNVHNPSAQGCAAGLFAVWLGCVAGHPYGWRTHPWSQSYYKDQMLSQSFQPMAAQLSKKAALPLTKILVTASCRSSKTRPSSTLSCRAVCSSGCAAGLGAVRLGCVEGHRYGWCTQHCSTPTYRLCVQLGGVLHGCVQLGGVLQSWVQLGVLQGCVQLGGVLQGCV